MCWGLNSQPKLSLLLTVFTLLIQAVVIVIGMGTVVDLPNVLEHISINVPGEAWSPTWGEMMKGVAMAMVAYTGIESIAQLGAEAKMPARTLPRAVMLTTVVLLVVYVSISVVALSAVTPQELGSTYILNPIAGIVEALPFGKVILAPS